MLGTGLLQGLGVTAKNFVGSFHDPARFTTREYPEVKPQLPENYRNFPFLVHDGDDAMATLRCVACKICEAECPPQCIYIEMERDGKGTEMYRPRVFDLDISVCMSCQICVEVCPFDAIKMDQHYEIAVPERFQALLLNRAALAKSNGYYHSIHPTEAAGVDALLAEQKAKPAGSRTAAAAAKSAAVPKSAAPAAPTSVPLAQPPATPSAEAPKNPPAAA